MPAYGYLLAKPPLSINVRFVLFRAMQASGLKGNLAGKEDIPDFGI